MVSIALVTASIILGIAGAQTIDYSSLPSCAEQCTLLTQANQACAPAPVYLTCFCQSAYLNGLSSSAASICPQCTSTSDQQAIVSWFNGQCQAGAAGTTAATTASIPAATGTTPTPTPTATGDSAPSTSSSDSTPTWWSQHYPWIIMVIVLLIGFGVIIAVGIMLKKRHNRKRNMAGNSGSGSMPVWGPSYEQGPTRGSGLEKEMGASYQGPSTNAGIGARAKNMLRH